MGQGFFFFWSNWDQCFAFVGNDFGKLQFVIHCDLGLFSDFFQNITELWEFRDLDNIFFFPQGFLLALISRVGFLLVSCEDVQSLALRGYCTPDHFVDCLCIFLKNYNAFVTIKI